VISFDYVTPPEYGCYFGVRPATTTIDLGQLPSGSYPLRLRSPRGNVEGYLTVESGSYRVATSTGDGIRFTNPELRRIPDRTVWGLIGYLGLTSVYEVKAQAFLDSLGAHGAVAEALEPGDYGAFTVDSSFVMQWPGTHGYYQALPYHLRSTRDPAELAEVVRDFASSDVPPRFRDRSKLE
jgi:hypothetical protein